ncbi:hypothetical protein PMSD_10080 [Paenibacillus macquariensis subsp. defensor]|nr:hypothetical protein PMSD_10080 [Paenibacillus macquariensis subsp. defensor]
MDWLKIWIRPRETMRHIINKPTNTGVVILLMLLGGFIFAMNKAASDSMADSMPLDTLFITIICATIIGAVIYYFLIGGLFYWVGSLLGGTGSYSDVRLSLAYAYIPTIITLLIWIPSLILFGTENFTSDTPRMDSSDGSLITYLIFEVIEFIIGIWGIFIYLKCLGEAHRFSAWKALLTVILPLIISLVIVFILIVILNAI